MADTPEDKKDEKRDNKRDRRESEGDRRGSERVVTESTSRRQKPDRRLD